MSPLHERGPLRIIVGEVVPANDAYARRKVRLVCGHEIWVASATIYRARCRHCLPMALKRLEGLRQ